MSLVAQSWMGGNFSLACQHRLIDQTPNVLLSSELPVTGRDQEGLIDS